METKIFFWNTTLSFQCHMNSCENWVLVTLLQLLIPLLNSLVTYEILWNLLQNVEERIEMIAIFLERGKLLLWPSFLHRWPLARKAFKQMILLIQISRIHWETKTYVNQIFWHWSSCCLPFVVLVLNVDFFLHKISEHETARVQEDLALSPCGVYESYFLLQFWWQTFGTF